MGAPEGAAVNNETETKINTGTLEGAADNNETETRMNVGAPEGAAVPAPLVTPVI